MQDYIDFAAKNGVLLLKSGACQFCGANTKRGIHECLEIFNFGFGEIDFSKKENHMYKFLMVDAHTLQHPEIHGRWNNHFHLSRLHLILKHDVKWSYRHSPMLSNYLKVYKIDKQNEYLIPPEVLKRGTITTTDILKNTKNASDRKALIFEWATEVHRTWHSSHHVAETIAKEFLNRNKSLNELI
ncbi:DUF5946 family protein [Maribacter sp. 2-571]|uniref:DUF5946 family protein n=1 Tax=Maribacter sp. 2-571 TaxID=3417569 RepID=UPI003D339B81